MLRMYIYVHLLHQKSIVVKTCGQRSTVSLVQTDNDDDMSVTSVHENNLIMLTQDITFHASNMFSKTNPSPALNQFE